ncbi:hypothetical protein BESB_025830 [Besnoitia besnoiti]|uniref:C2H2-type domain-containing protein n=1 Tax=Besnoitia besnoiti TaxID=94643 RepID=A0A2A9M0X3_BESBE|nr:uncharacterized protein BESB_025830 [Besnoitia besnoiti]PFH31609.1 hypothetical protein BESB_025830 [Besnoitia besnoiti]
MQFHKPSAPPSFSSSLEPLASLSPALLAQIAEDTLGDAYPLETPFTSSLTSSAAATSSSPLPRVASSRPLLYADYAASGRALRSVEEFIVSRVLPLYGNTHSQESATGKQANQLLEEARHIMKMNFNGSHEDAAIFCGNGASGAVSKFLQILLLSAPHAAAAAAVETSDSAPGPAPLFASPVGAPSSFLSRFFALFEEDRWGSFVCRACGARLKTAAHARRHLALHPDFLASPASASSAASAESSPQVNGTLSARAASSALGGSSCVAGVDADGEARTEARRVHLRVHFFVDPCCHHSSFLPFKELAGTHIPCSACASSAALCACASSCASASSHASLSSEAGGRYSYEGEAAGAGLRGRSGAGGVAATAAEAAANSVDLSFAFSFFDLDCQTAALSAASVLEKLRAEADLCAQLKRERVPAAFLSLPVCVFSATSNVTGLLSPTVGEASPLSRSVDDLARSSMAELNRLVHRFGGVACWDLAGAASHVGVDVNPGVVLRAKTAKGGARGDPPSLTEEEGDARADAVFFSPHKLLGGPGSCGLLLLKKKLLLSDLPAHPGGGSVYLVSGHKTAVYTLDRSEHREEAGTPNLLAVIRAAAAVRLLQQLPMELVRTREELWTRKLLHRLRAHPRIQVVGPLRPRVGIISLLFRYGNASTTSPASSSACGCEARNYSAAGGVYLHQNFVVALLNDLFGVQVRGGCLCASPYTSYLLSIQPELLEALEAMLLSTGQDLFRPGVVRLSLHGLMRSADLDKLAAALLWVASNGWKLMTRYEVTAESGRWRVKGWAGRREEAVRTWISENSFLPNARALGEATATLPRDASRAASRATEWRVPRNCESVAEMLGFADSVLASHLAHFHASAAPTYHVLHLPPAETTLPFATRAQLPAGPVDANATPRDSEASAPTPAPPGADGGDAVAQAGSRRWQPSAAVDATAASLVWFALPADATLSILQWLGKGGAKREQLCSEASSAAQLQRMLSGERGGDELPFARDAALEPSLSPQAIRWVSPGAPTAVRGSHATQKKAPEEKPGSSFARPEHACIEARLFTGANCCSCWTADDERHLAAVEGSRDDGQGATAKGLAPDDEERRANEEDWSLPASGTRTRATQPAGASSAVASSAVASSAAADEIQALKRQVASLRTELRQEREKRGRQQEPESCRNAKRQTHAQPHKSLAVDSERQEDEETITGAAAVSLDTRSPPTALNGEAAAPAATSAAPSSAPSSADSPGRRAPGAPILEIPRTLRRTVGEAIRTYDMIRDGDRLLVGVSGGKDSLTLLHVLRDLQRRAPVRFSVAAATVDPVTPEFNPRPLIKYMEDLGVRYHYLRLPIMALAKERMQRQSICAFCSRLKRGLLYSCMRRHGYNVLVLGQHLDDVCESFLMSAFHNGALNTMKGHYVNAEGDLRICRPLIMTRERETAAFAAVHRLPVIADNCPACFAAPKERHRMKMLLSEQETEFPHLFQNLLKGVECETGAQGVQLVQSGFWLPHEGRGSVWDAGAMSRLGVLPLGPLQSLKPLIAIAAADSRRDREAGVGKARLLRAAAAETPPSAETGANARGPQATEALATVEEMDAGDVGLILHHAGATAPDDEDEAAVGKSEKGNRAKESPPLAKNEKAAEGLGNHAAADDEAAELVMTACGVGRQCSRRV